MDLKIDISRTDVDKAALAAEKGRASDAHSVLCSGSQDFTGWATLPFDYDKAEFDAVLAAAEDIKSKCELLVVIGIGGSYLGARAAIEALGSGAGCGLGAAGDSASGAGGVRVMFAGNNISGTYHSEVLRAVQQYETCLCVISKSGTTTEPSIAFAVLKDALVQKYGADEAKSRIYAITDKEKGVLREEADREGYVTFVVPDNIGGRYSVLTPVGLLPIAAAGIDIKKMMEGAAAVAGGADGGECAGAAPASLDAISDYAIARYLLMQSGKAIEVFEYYEPQLQYFAEWLKQLFGESEGKEGRGLFPASLSFSADLHSMGQFLQEGNQIFFETVLNVEQPDSDIIVPASAGELLAGKSMNAVNQAAVNGVMAAHRNAGIPIVKIDIPALTPYYFGQMIYFFEMTCAITGTLMGVDPFNQPGVESYKAEMKKELKK